MENAGNAKLAMLLKREREVKRESSVRPRNSSGTIFFVVNGHSGGGRTSGQP